MGAMFPVIIAASAAAAREQAVLAAFESMGADGPARALPLGALPPLDAAVVAQLVERGLVREGAPGTFYRFVPASGGGAQTAQRIVVLVLVLVALMLLVLGALLVLRARDAR
jgi:hypothetical protein